MKNKILYIIFAVQMLFFASWIGYNELIKRGVDSKTILLETIPVDPRDFISGNYFILNYKFSSGNGIREKDFKYGKKRVYLVLKKDDSGYFRHEYLTTKKPKLRDGEIFIVGNRGNGWSKNIDYGIGRYYINEKTKEPKADDRVDVEVIVNKNGISRISRIFVNGEKL